MSVKWFKNMVLGLVKLYLQSIAIKTLIDYAKTPGPDIQFSLPIIGYDCDVWVTLQDKLPEDGAEFLLKTTINGIRFYIFWKWRKKGRALTTTDTPADAQTEFSQETAAV